jgi:hypothetical protein
MMKQRAIILGIILAAFSAGPMHAMAEENTADKVVSETGEAARDTGKVIKKKARAAKDKGCEMVNGKMDCAAKKLKHKAQNAKDEVNDKVDDVSK